MVFLALFELGSLLCGVATSSKMFIVGRAVAGMGGSGIVNGGLTMIAKCIPMEKRGGKAFYFPIGQSLTTLVSEVYIGIIIGSEWIVIRFSSAATANTTQLHS